jgi:hypothetical protein
VATKRPLSNRAFLAGVQDYLSAEAAIYETDADGRAAAPVAHDALTESTFYLLDAETLNALWHAIAELALEEANGTVLATLPKDDEVEHARVCLAQLARTVERLELLGVARAPSGFPSAHCLSDRAGLRADFRLLLYAGRRVQVVLLARPVVAEATRGRHYTGFYTLEPRLVRHFHALALAPSGGRSAMWREFLRLQTIDQAAKALRQEFQREEQALHEAVRRLQFDGRRYRPAQFASDLERGLSRLQQWKTRLPELVARVAAD